MKKLLAVSALFLGTLLSATQVNASATFDFQKLTDSDTYGKIYGVLANDTLFGSVNNRKNSGEQAFKTFNWTRKDNISGKKITLTASATFNGSDAWAYLDQGNAGLGVCHQGLKTDNKGENQCNPGSDDNVTQNEILNIAFDQRVSFNFINSLFRGANHGKLTSGNIDFSIDGIWNTYDLAASTGSGYIGQYFSFKTTYNTPEFYMDNMVVASVSSRPATVPEPSTLAIFALGMIGLASRRVKKQS